MIAHAAHATTHTGRLAHTNTHTHTFHHVADKIELQVRHFRLRPTSWPSYSPSMKKWIGDCRKIITRTKHREINAALALQSCSVHLKNTFGFHAVKHNTHQQRHEWSYLDINLQSMYNFVYLWTFDLSIFYPLPLEVWGVCPHFQLELKAYLCVSLLVLLRPERKLNWRKGRVFEKASLLSQVARREFKNEIRDLTPSAFPFSTSLGTWFSGDHTNKTSQIKIHTYIETHLVRFVPDEWLYDIKSSTSLSMIHFQSNNCLLSCHRKFVWLSNHYKLQITISNNLLMSYV